MVAGRYRLLRELGRGGMGVVWEGYDTLLDRPVAVKEVLLPPNLAPAEHERQLTRTSREARTAARLNHRGIVAVYDVAEQDGRPWIIMELVRARGLDQLGPLPVQQVADIGRQVLSALQAAHEAGILHRDVKPSNILLTPDGRAVLTDFGIATVEGDTSLTQTGMVTGSPSFLPPERATGEDAGPWSDLWALGATLYAALLGHGPFERTTAIATLGALLTEEPDFGRVPPAMREVLTGMLQRDPAHRLTPQQADMLLAEAAGDPTAAARRTGSTGTAPRRTERHRKAEAPTSAMPSRRRRDRGRGRLPLIVAAVVVLGGGGAAAAVAMTQSDPPGSSQAGPVSDTSTVDAGADATAPTETQQPAESPTPRPSRTRRPVEAGQQWKLWRAKAPENWSIRYPAGWRGDWAAETGYTQWLRPDGSAHMSVETLPGPHDSVESLQGTVRDDVAQWSEILSEDTAKVPVAYGSALQWEFTWEMKDSGGVPWARSGVTYHEVRRFIGVGDTIMVLSWTTADGEWKGQIGQMNQAFKSFHPRGGE
ncbi:MULTISPECIES: serine/threonine-protein kinase [Streptosporangium]|uniref:non-specific serine/threonine protein kinase n=1 Tax=Streptosporangium brasiliense TaxID=47480 RepID=A0ABT9RAJ0_9ACTN|nr:serine/threonine-protein kinase [Streptosporangium brasiliense]MDP9866267.1 serine/threonine protein kinase [Streptosporangium brasiliense]